MLQLELFSNTRHTVQLSPHFALAELVVSQSAARAGLNNTPTAEVFLRLRRLAQVLEEVRALLGGAPIVISSGYRSPAVNKLVGGSATSQHLTGDAADFIAPRFGSPMAVCLAIRDSMIGYDQLIYEFGSWVHLSASDKPRRMALTIDRTGTHPLQA